MTKFRKSLLIFGILALVIGAALATVVGLSLAGLLKTEKIELVFTVLPAEKTYDGEPLMASEYELTSGRYIEGHKPEVTFTGERTEIGVSNNAGMEVKMLDESGHDVTKEYSIKVVKGSLTVNVSALKIEVESTDIVYDGNTVDIGNNYYVVGGKLALGHRVILKIKDEWYENAGRIVAGKTLTEGDYDALIVDATGINVTNNYHIDEIKGRVTIRPRVITLAPVSVEKTYDGNPLTCSSYGYAQGSLTLVTNHRLLPSYVAADGGNSYAIDANEGNPLKIQVNGNVYDFDGKEVTANYLIYSETATVTVKKAPLEIVGKSKKWEYADKEYSLSNDTEPDSVRGLIEGDKVTVEYNATITDVSTVPNEIVAYYINDDPYNSNYTVTLKSGTLEVTAAPITVKWKKIEKQYGDEYEGEAKALYEIKTTVEDFDVSALDLIFSLSDLKAMIDEVKNVDNFTYTFSDFTVFSNRRNSDITKRLIITVTAGSVIVSPRAVKLAESSLSKTYDGNYTFEGKDGLIDDLVKGHTVSSVTCSAPQTLKAGTYSARITSIIIVDEFGNNVSTYYNITNFSSEIQAEIKARPITVKSDSVEKVYDGTALYRGVVTADKLAIGDRLDYSFDVAKNAVEDTNAPSALSILNANNENVKDFYDITDDYGTMVIKPMQVTVSFPDNCEIEYEADYVGKVAKLIRSTDIPAENFTFTEDEDEGEDENENKNVVVIGIHAVNFTWSDSPSVENTANYDIIQGNNVYTVIKKRNTAILAADKSSKDYDGKPLTQNDILNLVSANGTIEYFYSNLSGAVNAGSYGAEIVYETEYEKYTVTGTYTIKTLEIKVSANLTSVYDGKPYRPSVNELTAEKGYSVNGFTLDRDVVNHGDHTIGFRSVEFIDASGNVVSTNNVKVKAGSSITVNIQKRTLTITLSPAPGGTSNGADLRGLINVYNVADGDVIDLSDAWVAVSGNSTYLTPEDIIIRDENGENISDNYFFPTDDIVGAVGS